MATKLTIKQIIKDNYVRFNRFRAGNFYYRIVVLDGMHFAGYEFPVPLDDIGEATLLAEDRAILFMRYIRQAISDETFIKVNERW